MSKSPSASDRLLAYLGFLYWQRRRYEPSPIAPDQGLLELVRRVRVVEADMGSTRFPPMDQAQRPFGQRSGNAATPRAFEIIGERSAPL